MPYFRFFLLSFLFVFPSSVRACTIPVFRYALERWPLTSYEAILFHEGELPRALADFAKEIEQNPENANLRITSIDLKGDVSKKYRQIWEAQGAQTVPHVVVRLVEAGPKDPSAWSGPFSQKKLAELIDSPLRQTMVEKLTQGYSAVFLFLEGEDPVPNEKLFKMVQKELAHLEKAIEVPEQSAEGPQLKTNIPLKIAFHMIKVSRKDPSEQEFIRLLLATEPDLAKVTGPVLMPVFGRGRLLCTLFDDELDTKQLRTVVRFVCGECSCQVKELNPGVDLLISANWAEVLDKASQSFPSLPVSTPQKKEKSAEPKKENAHPPMPNGTSPVEEIKQTPSIIENHSIQTPNQTVPPRLLLFTGLGISFLVMVGAGIWIFVKK